MQNKKHLYHSRKRVVSLLLAGLMVVSTVLTGCGSITSHALEDDPTAPATTEVQDPNAPAVDTHGNELANVNVTLDNQTDMETALQSGSYSMVGYDYVVLPLFTPGSVASLYAHEIDVYVNGDTKALGTDMLGYNPTEGTLTINMTAMTVSEVKIVLRSKTDIGEPPINVETLDKTHSGMIPMYNVDTNKPLMPEIAFEKLTVGDVFAYETLDNHGTGHQETADRLWTAGASEFVYTSDFKAGMSASDTYWAFVGNIDSNLSKMDYTAGKKDDNGFIVELPFPDERKAAQQPVLIKSSSHKVKIGAPVFFGEKDDWKWNSEANAGKVELSHTIPGQSVLQDTIPTVAGPDPTQSLDWIETVSGIHDAGTFKVLAITDDYVILGFAQVNNDDAKRGTSLVKIGRFVKVGADKSASSNLSGAIEGNNCYADPATAEYTLYEDAEMTKPVGTVKADGKDRIGVSRGVYYAKETKAPVGYQMDQDAHRVEITENTVLNFTDAPVSDSGIYAVQKNVENRNNAGETAGDVGALKDILFDVYYFKGIYDSVDALPALDQAEEHAVLKTNEEGLLVLDGDHLVDGSWKYVDQAGKLTYPLGTVLVKEKQAVSGLTAGNADFLFTVTDTSDKTANKTAEATTTVIAGGSSKKVTNAKAAGSYENAVVKGGVSVTKVDADLKKSDYQGDAALSGAEFTIYNRSAAPVFYKDKLIEKGGVVDVITTVFDEASGSYVAATDAKVLEYGTYEIKETKAPEGYRLSDWSRTFKIREDGQMHLFDQSSKADASDETGMIINHEWCADDVIRGGVIVGKTDRETKGYESLGGASLAGTKFQVINKSKHPVVVDGTTYAADAVIMEITAKEMDVNGKTIVAATTGKDVLPYGTYDVVEISAGEGYLFDEKAKSQVKTFSICTNGEMVDFTASEDAFHDQVQRGDWYFTKKAVDSGKEMPNVAWTVTSVTTGETHVIVTDANGRYQSNKAAHSQKTNANDPNGNGAIALDEQGAYYVADESKLDPEAGTWFTGLKDHKTATVNDDLCAYPYDVYLVQELAGKTNAGYNLVSFMVTINQDGVLLDYGTVGNQRADLHVSFEYKADDSGSLLKKAPAKKDAELVSTVTYSGLTAGETYQIKQEVHAIDAKGKDTGVIAEKTTDLTAKAAGQAVTAFKADTTKLGGYKLVVTTEILQGKNVLVKATDLTNEDQTVLVESADKPTEPVEPVTGMLDSYVVNADGLTKEIYAGAGQKIQAAVKVNGMKENTVYKLEGTLYQIDHTGAAKAVTDASGKAVKAVIENPKEMNIMTFQDLDLSELGGKDLAVYQTLYEQDGKEWKIVSECCDAKDADLILHVPSASTKLTVKNGKLVDVVTFKNLTKGQTYTVDGSLHIREDEKTDNGYKIVDKGMVKNSHVTKEFKAAGSDGSVNVEFPSEKAIYNGKVVVAFEKISTKAEHQIPDEWKDAFKGNASKAERLVADHEDITDPYQTASILNIKSATLTTEDGSHEINTPGKVKLICTVDYEGAIPGATYNITETVNVKGDKGSKAVVATVDDTFTPEAVSGTVKLTCEVDVTDLNGETLVAFETISRNGNILVSRKDINDKDQSVKIAGLPSIDTVLEGDRSQAVDKNAKRVKYVQQKETKQSLKFTDTVVYENLTPGKEYTLKGELHLEKNGKDAGKLATGNAVTFTPKKADGTVEMTFTVTDANAKDGNYVAFEYLYDGDTLVTSHADIKDDDQTVKVALYGTPVTDVTEDDNDKTDKDSDKKLEEKKESIKTGENTFLLTAVFGLVMMLGGCLYLRKRGTILKK